MCGRVIQASPPGLLGLGIVEGLDERDSRFGNTPPRYNGAPSQTFWVIRRNAETGERSLDHLRWGLVPSWRKEKPKPPPINAMAETVARNGMFRTAYAKRRCILPVDGFFEWQTLPGAETKAPVAVAMRDRAPFALAGLWENWKDPASGEWLRTFCVITTDANDLLRPIHDRMPVILAPADHLRWLSEEADPRDLLVPFPTAALVHWPVSTRVNSPRNDDPEVIAPAEQVPPK